VEATEICLLVEVHPLLERLVAFLYGLAIIGVDKFSEEISSAVLGEYPASIAAWIAFP
jgi:hypothetical protein